jgi:hypothetical protein
VKRKESEYAGPGLYQRHISILSDDEEPDFDGCMTESVEEHADSDQDSIDERRAQINTGISEDQHQSRPSNQRAAVIVHGLDDQEDNTLIELQMEREDELRQEQRTMRRSLIGAGA